jgi:hypothetical protein
MRLLARLFRGVQGFSGGASLQGRESYSEQIPVSEIQILVIRKLLKVRGYRYFKFTPVPSANKTN